MALHWKAVFSQNLLRLIRVISLSDFRPISYCLSQNSPSSRWSGQPPWIWAAASVPLCLSSYFMGGKHQEAITQNKPGWLWDNYSTDLDVRQRSHPRPQQMTCKLPVAELNFNCVISYSISSANTHSAMWGSSHSCCLNVLVIAGRCCIVDISVQTFLLFKPLVYKARPATCAC